MYECGSVPIGGWCSLLTCRGRERERKIVEREIEVWGENYEILATMGSVYFRVGETSYLSKYLSQPVSPTLYFVWWLSTKISLTAYRVHFRLFGSYCLFLHLLQGCLYVSLYLTDWPSVYLFCWSTRGRTSFYFFPFPRFMRKEIFEVRKINNWVLQSAHVVIIIFNFSQILYTGKACTW